jgi:hypothetical protein
LSLVHSLDCVGRADFAQAWRNAGPKSRGELVAALPQFKLMLRGVLPENGRWGALGEISMAVVTNDVVHDVQTPSIAQGVSKDRWLGSSACWRHRGAPTYCCPAQLSALLP